MTDSGLAGIAPVDVPVDIMRDFHDRLAASGRLPVGLAARALMAEV